MVTLRKAADRGHVNLGWLDSRHTFSFGDYFDRNHMSFGPIRVINDDRIAGGGAFPMHPHADMEIVTYVLSGALEHQDSLGNGSVIRSGDVQRMSAGTGIRHSEANASKTEPVHLLQIWLKPERHGIAPSYEQTTITADDKRGRLRLIGSKDGRDGSVTINQDVALYASILGVGDEVAHNLAPNRTAWVQVATGAAVINGEMVETGDGVAITDAGVVSIKGRDAGTELLLFDMAA